MAQTISEANALNSLLSYLADDDPHGVGLPNRQRVSEALELLFKGSERTLKAGYKPTDATRLLDLIDARLGIKERAPAKAVKRKFGYTDADMREAEDWAAQHCDGDEVMHVVELPPFQYTTPSSDPGRAGVVYVVNDAGLEELAAEGTQFETIRSFGGQNQETDS